MSGDENVLLVEDDEAVRNLVHAVLVHAGYHVCAVRNGIEALPLCQDTGRPIDILLTDVIMPEMGGPKLADRIRDLRPTLKVLYMSGYFDNSTQNRGALEPGTPFISKPFTPNGLLSKVRSVLDTPVPLTSADA